MDSKIPFNQFGLSPAILETIEKKGFKFASEIQAKSIPVILEKDHDIVGIAQTGTGKTAAFGLPLIDQMSTEGKQVKCIILAPTRELAIQVSNELDSFRGKKRIKTLPVYGGQLITQQIRALRSGVDIVVGTPGRVMDLIKRKVLNLSQLDYFILDEADEMLKMGFIDDIESIMQGTPEDKRVFLYSATMPPRIKNLSKKYMKKQVVLEAKAKNVKRENIQQIYYRIRRSDKVDAIKNIIALAENFHGIIFCQTKATVNEVSDALKREKLDVDCIHGDINQSGREKILKKFKTRNINILVATDVAARGLDIDNLTHVINYSLPKEIDSYVHRIGRTGRAGKKGIALSFIDGREVYKINRLMRETKNEIVEGQLPSENSVFLNKQEQLIRRLEQIMLNEDTSFYAPVSKQLSQAFGDTKIISALLYHINGPEVKNKPKRAPQKEENRKSYGRRSGGGSRGRYGGNRSSRRSSGSRSGGGYKGKSSGGRFSKKSTGDFPKKKVGGFKKRQK